MGCGNSSHPEPSIQIHGASHPGATRPDAAHQDVAAGRPAGSKCPDSQQLTWPPTTPEATRLLGLPHRMPYPMPPRFASFSHASFSLASFQGAGRVIFETEVVETGAAAIKHAYVDLHTDESPPARL